jgi:hypothetical protein
MPPPKSAYLSAKDLAWFSLEKYSGLADFSYQQWCNLILSRVELQRIIPLHSKSSPPAPEASSLDQESYFQYLAEFRQNSESLMLDVKTKLQQSPLSDFGYEISTGGFKIPENESTVRMLNVGHVNHISDELRALNAAPSELIDPILKKRRKYDPSPLPPLAHVAVVLDAPEEKILGDFKAWLKGWRAQAGFVNEMEYEKGPETWLEERIVPYFDLQLVASTQGKKISEALLAATVFPDVNEYKLTKKVRNTPKLAKTVFSWGTINKILGLTQRDG